METMINLNDLLKHEILDLYSVEEQIIEALPSMIEKARNPELKKALREHLKVTEDQKSRLDKVKQIFGEGDGENGGENRGFFSRLFGGGSGGGEKCKGMEGIISEGQKILSADITDEALDAAIIASAQKIEHYEICGYGTARAFARELKLNEVEMLLTQSLNEEYQADDNLTALAVGKLNIEAEQANAMNIGGENREKDSRNTKGNSNGGHSDKRSSKGVSKPASKSADKGAKSSSKGSRPAAKNSGTSKNTPTNSSKGASKKAVKSASKSSSKRSGSSKQASRSGESSSNKTTRSPNERSGGNAAGSKTAAQKSSLKKSAKRPASKSGSRKH